MIGDSVTAGMGEAETWPKILAASHGVEIRNHAQAGATVRSAQQQANKMGDVPGVILLEIGGNDLLGRRR